MLKTTKWEFEFVKPCPLYVHHSLSDHSTVTFHRSNTSGGLGDFLMTLSYILKVILRMHDVDSSAKSSEFFSPKSSCLLALSRQPHETPLLSRVFVSLHENCCPSDTSLSDQTCSARKKTKNFSSRLVSASWAL